MPRRRERIKRKASTRKYRVRYAHVVTMEYALPDKYASLDEAKTAALVCEMHSSLPGVYDSIDEIPEHVSDIGDYDSIWEITELDAGDD